MNPILEIRNLSKVYASKENTVRALDDVSLTIHDGEVLSLLGVNGAGKTTLSSILATLHPPTSGSVLYKGTSIYDDIYNYRMALGFCPQKANLDPMLTVQENLEFTGRYYLMSEMAIKNRVQELLKKLNLEKYARFEINALSGGTRQRVLIARALMHSPRIVILDEPTVGLDPDIRRTLWDLIRDLKKMGITVIITTHYLDEAEYLSDRIFVLHHGKKVLLETMTALKAKHGENKLEEIFLTIMQDYRDEQ